MNWLSENWEILVLAATVASSILNAATRHWSEHKGVVKVMLFLSEILSLVTSKGSARAVKLPLTSVKVDKKTAVGASSILLVAVFATSCSWSVPDWTAKAQSVIKGTLSPVMEKEIRKRCLSRAEKCKKDNIDPQNCESMSRCFAWARGYVMAAKSAHQALGILNEIWQDLEKEKIR